MLYDGSVIAKETNVISIADSKETLMLEEEIRSKMLLKQSDLMVLQNKAPQELPKITPDALTEGEWGFEHTKVVFQKEIIPFLKTLKDIFNDFDEDLLNEKQFSIENDRLLDLIISQDIVNNVVNSSMDKNTSVKVNSSVVMNDSVNYVEI
ncbi:hypothetical protein Tco_0022038 [Tanacetum coccineum]